MERRALIAAGISILILLLYQELVLRRFYPPRSPEEVISEPETTPASAPSAAPERLAELAPPAPGVAAPANAQHVTVETDWYKAVFTTAGARLESFQLKKYRTTVDPDSPPQEMVVPGSSGELPFGVELRGAEVLSDLGVPYVVSGGPLNLTPGETGDLDFIWQSERGKIRKHFSFRGDRYDFTAVVDATNFPPEYTELAVSWVKAADAAPQPGSEVIFERTVYLDGRKLNEDLFPKLDAGKVVTGDLAWAGYSGRHFLAAMIPIDAQNERLWLKLRDHTVEEKLLFPYSAEATERHLAVYIGPKDFDSLEGIGHDLSRAVNLGWFGFIAVPLLHVLKFAHTFTGNYGLAIILLTVMLKILFIPLTQRSFRSMREMQKLQPQMTKIRERFKDKPEEMNKEIMELYRRHKVNPLGGCLPMVLQIPVFIGLYQALLNTVELRHAPFFLWINDLSAPDRLGLVQLPFVQQPGIPVLTLLMGGSMFLQQWMTPNAGDPAQQRVMMIMPLMFTFMFVNFPSGLALYWLVNNLLTIAQQYRMNRTAT
jgi:YidC/Oxa1 family membrane protein insertase